MNMTLKKALSDLRSSPGRTALALSALVLGLWGVGGMLVSYAILTDDQGPHAASYLGNQELPTPHLDALAREGENFADVGGQRIGGCIRRSCH